MKNFKEKFIKERKKNLFSQCNVIVQKVEDSSIDIYSINTSTISFNRGEQAEKDERIVGNVGKVGL